MWFDALSGIRHGVGMSVGQTPTVRLGVILPANSQGVGNMLAQTLQRLVNDELTNVREIAELTGVASSTVYRWLSGESIPDFETVRMLVRQLPNPRAKEAIISTFVAGTPYRTFHAEAELDVNQDGCIDLNDALDASINSVKSASDSLTSIRLNSHDDSDVRHGATQAVTSLDEAIRQCATAQQVLVHLLEENRRRKARPLR